MARFTHVVLVTHGDWTIPTVHGPYTEERAEAEAERLMCALARRGEARTGTPGEYLAQASPIEHGPIRISDY